ncbi:hypothetical protein GCM10027416_04960 [Okibacterium endophyticum]
MRTKPWSLAAAALALALTGPLLLTTSASAAPADDVKINEVIQDNDTIPDTVELINTGSTEADISGWVVKDDNDERDLRVPPATILAPGAFYAIVTDDDSLETGFGLGKADTARIFAADSTTLIDSFEWSGHQPTSYGRCPDGAGEFIVTAAATPGSANLCDAPAAGNIVINEIESSGGSPDDWFELMNIGTSTVDLSGLVVADAPGDEPFTIAEGTTLGAGGLVVFEKAQFGFGLGGGDSLTLFDTDGTTVIDSYSWTAHADATYGRCPDGVGPVTATLEATPGSANDCATPDLPAIAVNEIETSGGTPGDWIELYNAGATDVDLSNWVVRDSDDGADHAAVLPAGSSIAAGGFFVVDEAVLGYGLGKEDSARVYLPGGHTLVDSHSWTAVAGNAHAPTTFGRCPDGTGDWQVTTTSTKGAGNDCGAAIRINEIETQNGDPGDWVELVNNGSASVDVSGMLLRDDSDTGPFVIADGTVIDAGGFLALDVEGSFGLGGADSIRLLAADESTIIDQHSWTAHAATSLGRCPDGTGQFAETREATKGQANACAGDLITSAWPGGASVTEADTAEAFGSDISGLAFEPQTTPGTGTLWAVNNGDGTLHRLSRSDGVWANDTGEGWAEGKTLRYPDGTGTVDAEGVAVTSAGSSGGVFVSSERNTGAGAGGSRPSVLLYDVSGSGAELTAIAEWNLAADLPALGANAGLEGIAWIPDGDLVASGFVDQNTMDAYDPSAYAGHGDGLFFVGVEANGMVYAYALDQSGAGFTRIAAFESGFPGVMELEYNGSTNALWVVCDDTCDGRSAVFEIAGGGENAGSFTRVSVFERPADMPNLNNEGLAIAPDVQCVDGVKPVVWSDDGQTEGHALRQGTIACTADGEQPTEPESPAGGEPPAETPGAAADTPGELSSTGTELPVNLIALALVSLLLGGGVYTLRRIRSSAK